MKIIIVVACCLSGLARGSLEPNGYEYPNSYRGSNYLAPSSSYGPPKDRYIPASFEFTRQSENEFGDTLSGDQPLPLEKSPVPFADYPPIDNRQHDHREISTFRGVNYDGNSSPDTQYLPANENHLNSYVNSPPASDFLPPINNEPSVPSNAYLVPNVQSGQSSDGYSSQSGHAGQYSSNSVHRRRKNNHQNVGYHDQQVDGQKSSFGSVGYRYNAPENHTPAKYDFAYEVKDNYGNDYGHKESRSGESTRGMYTVLLPDGRRQIVHYEADSHGYRPTITYEDTGLNSASDKQGYRY